MRLIDADALKRNFEANTPVFAQDLVPGICAIIDRARTIDAVPAARSKNCWYPCVSNDDWVVCATGNRRDNGRRGRRMTIIAKVKSEIRHIGWRKRYCPSCSNLKLLSNFSPCYGCKYGNNYEKQKVEKE